MTFRKWGKWIGSLLLFAVCALFFSLIALLIVKPGAKTSPASAASAVQAEFPDPVPSLSTGNARALSQLFSLPLPAAPGQTFEGEIRSVPYEGNTALLVTMEYPAFTVSCVQPALASPLLLSPGLTPASVRIDDRDGFSILSMPSIYLKGENRHCFCFSDDSAAYAVYTDRTDLSNLVAFASALRWVN